MPPKAENGAAKSGMSNDAFLAACIKYAKDRVVVDFEALAKEIGMSKGGASNKFRAIMKQLEDDGATWAKAGDTNSNGDAAKTKATAKRKVPAKKNVNKTTTTDEGESDGSDADSAPAAKKKRTKLTARKAAPKPVGEVEANHESPSEEGLDEENHEEPSDGDN